MSPLINIKSLILFFFKLFKRKNNCRYFYYGFNKEILDKLCDDFLSNYNHLKFNKEVHDRIIEADVTFMVSSCSEPLVSRFVKAKFEKNIVIVLSSRLIIENGRYNGKLRYKVFRESKKSLLEAIFKKYNLDYADVRAYGNSPEDLPMLEIFPHSQIIL